MTAVAWRNLEDRGNPWRRGQEGETYPVVHQAVDAAATRCGLYDRPQVGGLVPTDRPVTCLRCRLARGETLTEE